jgi:hypothetical protein
MVLPGEPTMHRPLDRPTLFTLAAEADADPRSIERELAAYRGERPHVRGRAGDRVRAVLERHGLIPAQGQKAA